MYHIYEYIYIAFIFYYFGDYSSDHYKSHPVSIPERIVVVIGLLRGTCPVIDVPGVSSCY